MLVRIGIGKRLASRFESEKSVCGSGVASREDCGDCLESMNESVEGLLESVFFS